MWSPYGLRRSKEWVLIPCACAGRNALGMLPEPLVSVHSLGALAGHTNAQNTRILTELAREAGLTLQAGPHTPAEDHTSDGNDPNSAEPSSAERSDQHAASPADGSDTVSPRPTLLRDPDTNLALPRSLIGTAAEKPRQSQKASSGAEESQAGENPSPGSDAADHDSPSLNEGGREDASEMQRPSRLGSLIRRFRRREPAQADGDSSVPDSRAAVSHPDTVARSSDQTPSEPGQHDPDSKAGQIEPASNAAPDTSTPSQPEEGKLSDATTGSQSNHARAYAAGSAHTESMAPQDAEAEPPQATVGLDWPEMNSSMMQSLHTLVSTLTTALVAQVSICVIRAPLLCTIINTSLPA